MLSLWVRFHFVISSQNESNISYTLAFVTVGTYINLIFMHLVSRPLDWQKYCETNLF
jgi:hypothetical protein